MGQIHVQFGNNYTEGDAPLDNAVPHIELDWLNRNVMEIIEQGYSRVIELTAAKEESRNSNVVFMQLQRIILLAIEGRAMRKMGCIITKGSLPRRISGNILIQTGD